MSLAQVLATAVTGLRTTQSGMSLIASNVANAETPGYVRKTLVQSSLGAGGLDIGVRVDGINRVLDQYLQSQVRTESAGGAYADLKSQLYQRLQAVYGDPGGSGGLESVYNGFTTALQALTTSPDDYSARSTVLSSAQALTQQLNTLTSGIQELRTEAESGLSDTVKSANTAIQQIAALNRQLATVTSSDAAAASLMDQRDRYLDQLSQCMDIRVANGDYNQVNVFTTSGVQLVGSDAAHLTFTPAGALTANTQWSADPARRSVGTVTLTTANGASLDLVANKSIRSGQIAAYLEMRDQILPQAQSQLDQMAAAMASGLSDHAAAGTPVTAGAQAGFDVDIGNLSPGNTASFSYTDTATGNVHDVTVVAVKDASDLPLPSGATADPNDTAIGYDLSQGIGALVTQLNARFNGRIQFSNPAGGTLRILDDGAANKTDIDSAAATKTVTALAGGTPELPFFTDANNPFTGAVGKTGTQVLGFAGRIVVNANLLADPTKLVAYQAGTAAGDGTRPDFIYNQLTGAALTYSPSAGIGTVAAPFSGTVSAYIRQMLSQQGAAADSAAQLQQGQDVVVNALQQRMSDESGVNIDQEMSHLLDLQNAYAANARVMTTVRDMLQTLMNM